MYFRIINTAVLILACLALSSCAGLMNQGAGANESFEDMVTPTVTYANLTAAQHERVGDGYADDNERQKAFMHYAKALQSVGSESPEGLTLRTKSGLLILAQGLDEQALGEFQKVLALDPDHALANESAGEVYLRSGLIEEAKAHLDRALRNDPYLWKAHHLLGVLHSRQNRFDLAVEEYRSSLALSPDRAETLNNLGVAQLAQGHYAEALDAFQRALKAGGPKEKTYNNIGLALARMGRDSEALEAFKYAGDEAKAYNNLGYVLLLTGDTQRAVTCFEKAIKISPAYYSKAFENLKQAQMAEQFRQAGLDRPREQSLSPAAQAAPASFTMEDARLAPDPRPLNENDLPTDRAAEPDSKATPASTAVPAMPEVPAEPAVVSEPATEPADMVENTDQAAPVVAELAFSEPVAEVKPATATRSLTPVPAGLTLASASPALSLESRNLSLNADAEALEAAPEAASRPAYGLHVSSFKTMERAQAELDQLSAKGVEAYVLQADLGEKGQWYRVLAGRYETRAEAKKAAPETASLLGFDRLTIIEFKEPPLNMPPSESEGPVL